MEDKLSYCTLIYNGNELTKAISHVREAGYDGIELYPKDWRWALGELGEAGLINLFRNLSVSALFGGVLSEQQEGIAEAKNIAQLLDVKYIFIVAPPKNMCLKNEEILNMLEKAYSSVKNTDIKLIIHNHAGTLVETIESTLQLFSNLDKLPIGLCFDSVHYALFHDDLVSRLEEIIHFIDYVHLKDMNLTRQQLSAIKPVDQWKWGDLSHIADHYTGLENGVIDNESIAKRLKDLGYAGWWLPEIERKEINPLDHAIENFKVLKSYL
ncbi:MAG: TIM barrel protein [Eubacteriales bacterium]|nr:TIM barrel protein [Eubacteriales bacterium]